MNCTATKKKVLIILSVAFLSLSAHAQQKKPSPVPKWVTMMNDPDVNYYEAVREFDDFWKNKEKPIEEDDVFSDKENNRSTKKVTGPDAVKYRFEYKKFLNWKRENAAYVKADGHILSAEEKLHLFEEERKRREQAQGYR